MDLPAKLASDSEVSDFLQSLEAELESNLERAKPLSKADLDRIKLLVGDAEIDLAEALSPSDED